VGALAGISKKSKIALAIAGAIMGVFFAVQSCIVFGLCEPTYFLAKFGYGCVIAFMPPFFMVVREFITKTKIKEAKIDSQLNAIDHSNLIVTLGIDGHLISANNKFTELVGYSEKELKGKPHSLLCDPKFADSENYQQFWDKLKQGQFISGEFERVGKDGKSIWLFGTYTPIQNSNGEYYRVLKIAVDITTQHLAEDAVKQKSVYLEHASKIIRHDMHSGINTYLPRGIKSLLRRLSKEDITALKIGAPLRLIQDGLHHAQKVYAGVYEFTNLVKNNAQMSKSECNVKEILGDYLRLTAYKNQVILDDSLPTIDLNEPLFCTAIDNLIRNGLKYNDSGTKWIKIYKETDHFADNFICIEDNGRGLTGDEFRELSKPYVRKKGQKEQGTGLGLNISLAILKEHGFSIWAEKQKQGTKIKIKIQ
jgi:two-component system sensor histidine kinase/response regulator